MRCIERSGSFTQTQLSWREKRKLQERGSRRFDTNDLRINSLRRLDCARTLLRAIAGEGHEDDGLTVYINRQDAASGRAAGAEQKRKQRLSFTTEQWVPFPIERVFAFFADPLNLPRLLPAWQDARIDSLELQRPDGGGVARAAGRGSRILLSFRPIPFFPVRLRWLALIDDYVADHHFCDLQVTGPFGYWRHCHLVSQETHGDARGTRVVDVVDYAWPLSPVNPAIDMLGGRLQIRQLFHYRQRKFLRLLRKEIAASS